MYPTGVLFLWSTFNIKYTVYSKCTCIHLYCASSFEHIWSCFCETQATRGTQMRGNYEKLNCKCSSLIGQFALIKSTAFSEAIAAFLFPLELLSIWTHASLKMIMCQHVDESLDPDVFILNAPWVVKPVFSAPYLQSRHLKRIWTCFTDGLDKKPS